MDFLRYQAAVKVSYAVVSTHLEKNKMLVKLDRFISPPKVWSENSKQIIETTFSGFLSKQSFGSHFLGSQPQSFLIQFSLKKNTFRKNPPCSVWRASESLTKLLGIDL